MLFDQGFDVSTGIYSTGMRNGMHILTNCREIILKSWTRRKAKEWVNHLKSVASNSARDFTCPNPHNSYAPVRTSVQASWFVDGASYMSAVADALEAATEEIYIADWWLSPEIYMKRPAIDGDYWRLDNILKRKANQGILVFILLYKEVEMALGINSYYSKQRLVLTHENIKVFRHPDHARAGVFFWAHHEKIIVVDQTYAFFGGIDLCYGRWDDYKHRLTDLGSVCTASASIASKSCKESLSNIAIHVNGKNIGKNKATVTIAEPKDTVDSSKLPQLEPGDKLIIKMSKLTQNEGAEVIPENFKQNTPEMERRNMLGKLKDISVKGKTLMSRMTSSNDAVDSSTKNSPAHPDKAMFFGNDELKLGAKGGFVDPAPFQTDILGDLDGQAKYWIGKDYVNFILKDFTNLEAPYADLIDRSTTPRMPWHDIGAVVVGASARDIARHFIQRWNATKLEKARVNTTYPYLLPKSYVNIRVSEKVISAPLKRVTCQVLRSVSSWSCGFIEQDIVEQSIHDAYIQTINKAQHYIYIENQFFISLEFGLQSVRNQVADALYRRIIRAHK